MKKKSFLKVLFAVLSMLALAVGQTAKAMTGTGTQTDPFVISSVADWNTFAANVNAGTNADKYYQLDANIGSSSDPVTSMVGLRDDTNSILNPFSGHFDGNGKTLYVNVGGSVGAAPFRFIDGATIENLTVQGAVTCDLTDSNHAGGLVGLCGSNGSILIKNCIVEANVSLTNYGGGIVGHAGHGNMTLQDCVFKGSINNFTTYAGGLIGWCDALTLTITNCFFVGSFTPGTGGKYHPIGCCNRPGDVTTTITNAYYLNGITATAESGKIVPNATGTPINDTSVANTWDTPITAPDGTTYYGAHVNGGSSSIVEIGDGTNMSYYVPINPYWGYSLTQQIYTADEIGGAGNITSISFHYAGANTFTMEGVQIYMKNVDKDEFSSNTDMEAISASDLVFDGNFEFAGEGWIDIELDAPFAYDGTSNLLLCCYDPTNGYFTSSDKFYTTATTGYMALVYCSDSAIPDLNNITTYGGNKNRYQSRSNIKLEIIASGVTPPAKPTSLVASDITYNSATLTWDGGTGKYNVEYKATGDTDWTRKLSNTTNTTCTLTGLTAETDYEARVQSVDATDNTSVGAWRTTTFTTPIRFEKPTGLTATLTPLDGTVATLSWTENGTATQWQLQYGTDEAFGAGSYTETSVSSMPSLSLTGLTPETTYYARVRSVYEGEGESQWSDVISFQPTDKIVIGSGTSTNSYLPSYSFFKYALSQQIYTADEIGTAGSITTIDFYNSGTEKTRNYDIYLVHTDKKSFSSGDDWITASASDLVFSGSVTMVSGAWTTIDLDTPFAYDGTSNLALIVDDNTGSDSQGMSCRVFSATSMALYKYNDTTNYDPTNPNVTGNVTNSKNQIRLGLTASGVTPPSRPTSLVASDITYNSATLTWDGGSGKYNVEYKATTDTDWTRKLSNTTNTTCTLTGLTADTDYEARVQSVDATDNTLVGGWRATTFATLIRFEKPTDLTATLTPLDGTQTTLSWTENGTATQWQLQYGTDSGFATYDETTASGTSTKTLTGLTPEAIYYARVRSVYEGEGESQWSEVISFQPTDKIVIGSGTDTHNYLPSASSGKYALSQQIYTADEIGMAGIISSIEFYNAGTEKTRSYDIYLVQTDKESYTSYSDLIAVSGDDKVFSGSVTMVSGAWTTITFNIPFAYDGTNNILLVVDDNTGTADNGMSCRVFTSAIGDEAIYLYSTSDSNYDPTNPNISGSVGRLDVKSQIRLGLTPYSVQPLSKPTGLTAALTPGNGTIATLSWTENGTATQWTLQYGTDETFADGTYTEVSASGTPSKAITGLTAETTYYARVKAVSVGNESFWSATIYFTPTNDYVLTVHDGTATNQFIPLYGYYCDSYLKGEFVMPADELSGMAGGHIDGMTFYLSQPATADWGDANFQVFMKEVSDATISTFSGTNNATIVYEGALDGTQSTMTIDFTTPYPYGGGNLLIGIYNTVKGDYKKCFFYGETVNNASVYGHNSNSLDEVTPTSQDFLPKTTFAFTPSGGPTLPTSFTATNVTYNSATLTWEGGSGKYNVEYKATTDTDWTRELSNTTNTTCTLTGLTSDTDYEARVQSVDATDNTLVGSWRKISFTTPLKFAIPTNLAAALTQGNGTIATLTWTENNIATQWLLQYGRDETFANGTYTEVSVSGTPSLSLTGLTPEITYYARVKSVYGDGESDWSSVYIFTPTDAYTLTVHDGTETNQYVPIDGYDCDYYDKCEFVMPAAELSAMSGGDINAMTFYISQPATGSWGNANFQVFMKEVSDATIDDFYGTEDATIVYEGSLDGTQSTLTIDFDTPYTYGGGNLLIGVYNTVKGTYKPCVFYGENISGVCVQGTNSGSLDAISPTQRNFLPKTTFSYTSASSCPKPTNVTISDISDESAVVSWTSSASAWTLRYKEVVATVWTTVDVTTTSYTITGLDAGTRYEVQVRTNCGGGDYSNWTKAQTFTTTLCPLAYQSTIHYTLTDGYGDGWNDAKIQIVHVNSGIVVAELAAEDHNLMDTETTDEGTLNLCCGEEYDFVWVSGQYDAEISFVIYDANGYVITSFVADDQNVPTEGTLATYTLDCGTGLDLNHDGNIDVDDVETLANIVVGNISQTGYSLSVIDINGDGHVSVADVTELVNYIKTLVP